MRRRGLVAAAAVACVAGGCAQERVVGRRGLLAGLPGAQSEIPAKPVRSGGGGAGQGLADAPDPKLRVEDAQGNVTLISRSARDVLVHVVATLKNEEEDLFLGQVLSEATRQEFIARGHDPVWAYRELKRRERDVRRLYSAMPYGEYTPGLFLDPVGRNAFRVKVRSTGDLKWSFIDVVIEKGSWRLRWFGP